MESYCKIVEFGSKLYKESIDLRDKVLRQPLGLQFSKEELAQENDSYHLVYIEEGQVIGVIVLRPLSDTIFKMRQVAIAMDWQRKGIGQSLVRFSEDFAGSKGIQKITLHARDTAVPFYLKLGYHTLGEPFTEVGVKHFKMERNI